MHPIVRHVDLRISGRPQQLEERRLGQPETPLRQSAQRIVAPELSIPAPSEAVDHFLFTLGVVRGQEEARRRRRELCDQLPRTRQVVEQATAEDDVELAELTQRDLLDVRGVQRRIDREHAANPARAVEIVGAPLDRRYLVPSARELDGLRALEASQLEHATGLEPVEELAQ